MFMEEVRTMKVRFARQVRYSMIAALLLVGGSASRALAQGDHNHAMSTPHQQTDEQKKRTGALVKAVREATEGFQNPDNAPGYSLVFGCVSGGDFGAMGMHFLNGALLGDGDVKVETPEILLYEPLPN